MIGTLSTTTKQENTEKKDGPSTSLKLVGSDR